MGFTDEDLKRLTVFLVDDQGTYVKKAVEGVIARLKAAERLFSHSQPGRGERCRFCGVSYEHTTDCGWKAWRKSAGKD